MLKEEIKNHTRIALLNGRGRKITRLGFRKFVNTLRQVSRRDGIMHMCLLHEADVEAGGPRRLMLKKQELRVERRRDLSTLSCLLSKNSTPYV